MAHIGVIRVLQREGIMPDLIVGTSMGAVIGGMYAQIEDIDEVERKILSFIDAFGVKAKWLNFLGEFDDKDRHDMFRDIAYYIKKRFAGFKALTRISLEDKKILYDPLSSFFSDEPIENCKIPFAAVALDIRNGSMEVLNNGSIIESVYASAAVQGVFPPIDYRDMLLCDGGPIAIVPAEAARILGAHRIIAVNVSPDIKEKAKFASGLEIILRADSISQDRLRRIDQRMADIVIAPRVHAVHWANFTRIEYCIRRGETAAEQSLDMIKNLTTRRPWWRKFRLFGKRSV